MQQPRLITALITPFQNGKVDYEGLRRNIAFQLEEGVEGILVLGTTGESPTLTSDERHAIISTTVETVAGRASVWVGTGTNSTQTTIERTNDAHALGADAALVVTPYYNCPTQEGIYEHFAAICEQSDIPICLYNIPKRTGRNINIETIKRIATLPNIIGDKESTGDMGQAAEILAGTHLSVWSGDDALTLPIMSLGGVGVISVASNLIPGQMRDIVEAASNGDFLSARQKFSPMLPLLKALFIETNPMPVKAAMDLCGMAAGPCRLPLGQISSEHREMLQDTMTECGIEFPLGVSR